MNIVYLIGNGFDLNLGLKTSYKDFYDFYLRLFNSNNEVCTFKSKISSDLEKWADLERELGKYTNEFYESDESKFIELLDDIQDSLANYLEIQMEKLIIFDDNKEFFDDIFNPEKYLNNREKEKFIEYKNGFFSQPFIADIIIFNYTNTLEKIIDWTGNEKIVGTHRIGDNVYTDKIKNIEHIHGTTNSNMIIGVNDSSQIDNESFKKSSNIISSFVKTEINMDAGTLRDRRCEEYIKKANIICIFGMSLGETDKIWWEAIIDRLKNTTVRLIIFTKDIDINPRRSYRTKIQKDVVINKLLSYSNFNDEEKESIKKRIFVCVNSEMFKINAIIDEDDLIDIA